LLVLLAVMYKLTLVDTECIVIRLFIVLQVYSGWKFNRAIHTEG